MKRFILIAVLLVMAFSPASAEEAPIVKKDFELKDAGPQAMTGIIRAVLPADLAQPRSRLIIGSEEGKEVEFSVRAAAVVYDAADGRILSLTELKAGDRVRVNYNISKDGVCEAMAVRLLSKEETKGMMESIRAKEAAPAAEEAGIK